MNSKFSINKSVPKMASLIDNTKKELLIRNNGILFLLMKVYLIAPENLKNLVNHKNYFYIYYPIRNSDFFLNKNFKIMNKYNKFKICLTKKDIIEETKFFLGINKYNNNYDFNLYNQNLGILKNDYQLLQTDNINNNIIYIKIKLNKENSKIRPYNESPNIPKLINYRNTKSNIINFMTNKPIKNNSELNLKKLINDTVTAFNPGKKRKYIKINSYLYRNNSVNNNYRDILTSYTSNKIDKNTTTEDLGKVINNNNNNFNNNTNNNNFNKKTNDDYDYVKIENYQNLFTNLKNINHSSKNIYDINQSKRNLSSLDYCPNIKEAKITKYRIKLVNKYKLIKNIKKGSGLDPISLDSVSIRGKASYLVRKKFVKSLYSVQNKNTSSSRNKKIIRLSQPSIIKSYMEVYNCNLNNNKIEDKNND